MSYTTAPIHNPSAPKSNIGPSEHEGGRVSAQPAIAANLEGLLRPNYGSHNRSAGDINRLVVGHDQVADLVNAGAEENDIRIARLGRLCFRWISEKVQRPNPVAVDLDGQQLGFRKGKAQAFPLNRWSDLPRGRQHLGRLDHLRIAHSHGYGPLHIEIGKGGVLEILGRMGFVIHRLPPALWLTASDLGDVNWNLLSLDLHSKNL